MGWRECNFSVTWNLRIWSCLPTSACNVLRLVSQVKRGSGPNTTQQIP